LFGHYATPGQRSQGVEKGYSPPDRCFR
jgi:hypothetical protein